MKRVGNKPDGKYVDVTAISPTPLGEGNSTCCMGLVQGLGKRNQSVIGAIRQPSGGPPTNINLGRRRRSGPVYSLDRVLPWPDR